MSNYPNMSYCAFENTAAAIRQLIGMLGDAIDEGEPREMSSYQEQRAFDEMQELIESFQETLEQYNEHFPGVDGEDADAQFGPIGPD
jgi:predicted phage gp36 major capsid-like protein